MPMGKPQRIRDPLHNLIAFDEKQFDQALWRVIQTPDFQRLRRIKQLGFSELVYPGATHTRFSHSLGVYHIAKRLLEIIRQKDESDYNSSFGRYAKAAALLHDIGHGPFSHAFEDVGKRLGFKLAKHEDVSDAVIRHRQIAAILDDEFGTGFSANVADLIKSSGASRGIYGAVVSSQFDADRLDYMQRDRIMTGTQVGGSLDCTWLLSNLRIGEVDWSADDSKGGKRKTFVLGPKAIHASEAYIIGLFQMYPTVYFHKATRGAEKLFSELLVRAFSLVREGDCAKTNLPSRHPLKLFAEEPEKLERAMALDDSVVMGALPLLAEAEDKLVADFARRLLERRLFKCIDVRERLRHALGKNEDSEQRLVIAQQAVKNRLGEWSAEHSQDFPRILRDEGRRNPYKRFQDGQSSLLDQILIQEPSGDIIEITDCSELILSIRTFEFFRVYVASDDSDARKIVDDAIEEQKHVYEER